MKYLAKQVSKELTKETNRYGERLVECDRASGEKI